MSRVLPSHLAAQLLAVGARYGIDRLALDDDGVVALCFDDGITVELAFPDPLADLLLQCEVGVLSAHCEPAVLIELLQFNRVDLDPIAPVLGLTDDDPPRLVAAQRVAWRGLLVAECVAAVEAFVALMEDLDALCRAAGPAEAGPAPGMFRLRG